MVGCAAMDRLEEKDIRYGLTIELKCKTCNQTHRISIGPLELNGTVHHLPDCHTWDTQGHMIEFWVGSKITKFRTQ